MDPGSILGLLGSAGAITACIVGTLKDLADLRAKFAVADTNIKLLKSELTAIKSALDRIHDWAKYNLEEDQTQAPKLGEGLGAILEGCRVAMEVLAEDVADLLHSNTLEQGQVGTTHAGESHLRLGFRDKTRLVWHESALKDHQERLSRQTGALHLLLTAIQCTNISEQTRLLRTPENQQKIQDVVDDTSTIRAARSQRASIISPSIKSGPSTIPSRAFPFDEELLRTDAYLNATHHQRSKSDSRRDTVLRRPELNIQIQDHLLVDEGYDTMSRTTSDSAPSASHLSPTWSRGSTSRPLRPYETNPVRASDSGNVYKIQTANLTGRFDSSSRLPYSPLQSPTVKTLDRKKSFWHSLRRKSDSAIEEHNRQQETKSPIPGSQRGKKGFENKFHTSVDLSTSAARKCPPIVRAAQTGSIDEIESLLEAHADIEESYRPIGRNAMAVAAHCGNAEVVELLLRYGARISQQDNLHYTPLHLAASRGHVGVLQLLVSEDVPLEEKGPHDKSALRLSCDGGHLEAAELLLVHGAKVNARDKSNLTSLHAAAQRGDFHTVALLINYGAHVSAKDAKFMDALHYACDGGFDNVVELLLSKKVDIETPGNEGKTPLMTAASAGHAHTVDFLLKRKASLKSKGSGDMTALHWAAFNGHVEVVDLLAQKKAQINAVNVDGRTPLHLAVMAEHFAVVELLLRKNAALEARCKDSFRPLHYACGFDNTDIVLLLLRSGADVEATASAQNRPLHLAITKGNISNVTMLLEHGAMIDARNADGDRALLLASSHGHTEIVKVLLDRGASLRSKFAAGPSHEDSPLCIAAKNGHSDVVDLLIGYGASVREKDEHAWQPLRYGAYYGHPEVVERLLAAGASIPGIQTWGFNLTADRIGFAQNVTIPEDRKEHVMALLRNAEETERLVQESEVARPPRGHMDNGGVTELEQATQPRHVELRSSTTRAGPAKLSRRFSYEEPSQPQSESQYSSGDPPQPPSNSVSPMPLGEPGLASRRNRSEADAGPPMPHYMRARSAVQPPASASSANMDTTPARTKSEHMSSRYRDVTRRWQEAVTDRPNRSATVASNVYNLRKSGVSQPSVFSPGPSAMSYQTVSAMDGPGPAYRSSDSSYTSSMPWSADSITQPRAENVASPPPPTRPPPPPPAGTDNIVHPWQVTPAGRVEMG